MPQQLSPVSFPDGPEDSVYPGESEIAGYGHYDGLGRAFAELCAVELVWPEAKMQKKEPVDIVLLFLNYLFVGSVLRYNQFGHFFL